MSSMIEQCRENFGASPRAFPWIQRVGYLRISPPNWLYMDKNSPLWAIFFHKRDLLERGQVVWGRLVHASSLLFSRGWFNAPALAIYSPDPYFDDHPEELTALGKALFELKGTEPEDAELAELARVITKEHEAVLRVSLPPSMTGGREVYATSLIVYRRHIPRGYLTRGLVPLLILPEKTDAVIILPSRYWAEELLKMWEE